jgi:hypothetical protein
MNLNIIQMKNSNALLLFLRGKEERAEYCSSVEIRPSPLGSDSTFWGSVCLSVGLGLGLIENKEAMSPYPALFLSFFFTGELVVESDEEATETEREEEREAAGAWPALAMTREEFI